MIVFKLERERPAFATHGSLLYYIKERYIRCYDFSTQRDNPLVAMRRNPAAAYNQGGWVVRRSAVQVARSCTRVGLVTFSWTVGREGSRPPKRSTVGHALAFCRTVGPWSHALLHSCRAQPMLSPLPSPPNRPVPSPLLPAGPRALAFNPAENQVLVQTDIEGGTYELYSVPKDAAGREVAPVSGRAAACIYGHLGACGQVDDERPLEPGCLCGSGGCASTGAASQHRQPNRVSGTPAQQLAARPPSAMRQAGAAEHFPSGAARGHGLGWAGPLQLAAVVELNHGWEQPPHRTCITCMHAPPAPLPPTAAAVPAVPCCAGGCR